MAKHFWLTLLAGLMLFGSPAVAETLKSGGASWYGTTAHGKKTASGEVFNRYDFTTAHRSMPFGLVCRVFNPQTDKHVLVEVTDRGPFAKGRVLDLSKQAAKRLGMIEAGVAKVQYSVVSDKQGRPLNSQNSFYIRLSNKEPAQRTHALSSLYFLQLGTEIRAFGTQVEGKQAFVLGVGPYPTFAEARKAFKAISSKCPALDIMEAPTNGGDLPSMQQAEAVAQDSGKSLPAQPKSNAYPAATMLQARR